MTNEFEKHFQGRVFLILGKKLLVESNKEEDINESTFDKMRLKIVQRSMITYGSQFAD